MQWSELNYDGKFSIETKQKISLTTAVFTTLSWQESIYKRAIFGQQPSAFTVLHHITLQQ